MWLRLSSSHHASHGEFPEISGSQVKLRYMPVNWVSSEAIDAINQANRCQVCGDYWINSLGKMWWVLKVFKICCMG